MEFAMTDVTLNLSDVTFGQRWLSSLLGRPLAQAMMARSIRRTLQELPDAVLEDIGLSRSEIPFLAGSLASSSASATCGTVIRFATSHRRP